MNIKNSILLSLGLLFLFAVRPPAAPAQPCQGGISLSLNLFLPQTAPGLLTVTASLCYGGHCTVDVFNSAGEHIRALANFPNQPAGSFQSTWDGKNASGASVATGTYIIRFAEPTGAHLARVLLVR